MGVPLCASVLIVDDDSATRENLAVLLEQRGHVVDTASNGREALEKMEHGLVPRLLILDLLMPVMNGYELRAELLRRPGLAKMPVVIASGTISDESTLGLAAEALMPKPLNLALLYKLVDQHCGAPPLSRLRTSRPPSTESKKKPRPLVESC